MSIGDLTCCVINADSRLHVCLSVRITSVHYRVLRSESEPARQCGLYCTPTRYDSHLTKITKKGYQLSTCSFSTLQHIESKGIFCKVTSIPVWLTLFLQEDRCSSTAARKNYKSVKRVKHQLFLHISVYGHPSRHWIFILKSSRLRKSCPLAPH